LLLVALLLAFWATRTHEARLTVAGVDWQRTVEVEELQTLTESAWEGEVPSDARVLRTSRELHHVDKVQVGTQPVTETYTERVQTGTKKVKVGVKDLGNGHFEDVYKDEPVYENQTKTRTVQKPIYRDNPVYRSKITYQVDRWKTTRTAEAKGLDVNPQWPAVPSGPKVRAGKRAGKYVVHLSDPSKGKTYDYEVEEDKFTRFAPGSVCRARINNFGSISELDPPE
jgi:hypothetical protein